MTSACYQNMENRNIVIFDIKQCNIYIYIYIYIYIVCAGGAIAAKYVHCIYSYIPVIPFDWFNINMAQHRVE